MCESKQCDLLQFRWEFSQGADFLSAIQGCFFLYGIIMVWSESVRLDLAFLSIYQVLLKGPVTDIVLLFEAFERKKKTDCSCILR